MSHRAVALTVADGYAWIDSDGTEMAPLHSGTGRSLADVWRVPEVWIVHEDHTGRALQTGDVLAGDLGCVRTSVVPALRGAFGEALEFLPVDCKGLDLVAVNVRRVAAGVLDVEASVPDPSGLTDILGYEFHPERLDQETIFRLAEDPILPLVSPRGVQALRGAGLQGWDVVPLMTTSRAIVEMGADPPKAGEWPVTTAEDLLAACVGVSGDLGEKAVVEGEALLRKAGLGGHARALAAFAAIIALGRAFGSGKTTADRASDKFDQPWLVDLDDDWEDANPMFDLLEEMREAVAMSEPTFNEGEANPGWLDLSTSRDTVLLLHDELVRRWLAAVVELLRRR